MVLERRATRSSSIDRAAYALAGYAVLAAHFGLRFGTLSLDRAFTVDLAHLPERAHLLTILYAGHTAEAARFLALQETLAGPVGQIDATAERRARLAGHALVQRPQNRAAVEALAQRLAAGETLGYLTARRIIRPASAL